jgi:hypothetical protein
MPKTWRQKLHNGASPKVEITDKAFAGIPAGVRMLIPTPLLVKEYVERIPKGQTRTLEQVRIDLAKEHGAEFTCPLTTGIFIRIVAEAALDERLAGKGLDQITPFWRVLDEKSKAAKKLTCGPEFLTQMRQSEV